MKIFKESECLYNQVYPQPDISRPVVALGFSYYSNQGPNISVLNHPLATEFVMTLYFENETEKSYLIEVNYTPDQKTKEIPIRPEEVIIEKGS